MNTKTFHEARSLATALTGALLVLSACEVEDTDEALEDEMIDEDDDELRLWTGFTSEEFPPLVCGYGQFVRGFDCQGRYCDNVRIDCHYNGVPHGTSSWTSYFSEEGSGAADERHCPWGSFVTGIACSGGWCDNLSLLCTEAVGRGTGNCQWSPWYSEEHGPFQASSGRYIAGVECNGGWCDNKRYRHCQMI